MPTQHLHSSRDQNSVPFSSCSRLYKKRENVCVSVCVIWAGACVRECGGLRSTLDVISQEPFTFLSRVSLTWGLPVWFGLAGWQVSLSLPPHRCYYKCILPQPTFYKAPGTQTQACAGSTLLIKPILQQPSSCFSKWLCISAGSSIPVPWPPFHPRAPPFHAPIPAPHCSLC